MNSAADFSLLQKQFKNAKERMTSASSKVTEDELKEFEAVRQKELQEKKMAQEDLKK